MPSSITKFEIAPAGAPSISNDAIDDVETRDVEMADAPVAPQASQNGNAEAEYRITILGLAEATNLPSEIRTDYSQWDKQLSMACRQTSMIKPSKRLVSLLGVSSMSDTNSWQFVLCPVIKSCLHSSDRDFYPNINLSSRKIIQLAPLEFHFESCADDGNTRRVLHLYYSALELLLQKHTDDNRKMLLLNVQFHKSLYWLCHFCIVLTTGREGPYIMRDTGSCPIVYYKLMEDFLVEMNTSRAFMSNASHSFVLPMFLIHRLRIVQEMILDSLWLEDVMQGSRESFVAMVQKLQSSGVWPIPSLREKCPMSFEKSSSGPSESSKESMFVGYILHKTLMLAERRCKSLCEKLSLPNNFTGLTPSKCNQIKEKTMALFTSLMCHRVELFYHRHPDQILLCAMYMICSKLGLALKVTFVNIVRAYESYKKKNLKLEVVQRILYDIPDCMEDGSRGGMISFFNVSRVCFSSYVIFWVGKLFSFALLNTSMSLSLK